MKEATMPETTITAEPGSSLITMTREFDAPRELVFRAHVDPDLLVQWLGPRELTMTVDRYEARDGGTYRYVHHNAQGGEYGFHGVFHGDPTPDGLVQTFEFEGAPGHVSLNIYTFTQRGDRTELRTVASFASVADRDAILDADMSRGVQDGHDRLGELLAALLARA
jgi:uncharacterized protein YndB with AHSA1/START domain